MNVLTLMVDELSWWALGHTGGIAKTPNIDALAARGMQFTQAYTPSPICVPTRAAIATGRHVHEVETWSSAEPYQGQMRGWAHAVRDAGFECASIEKLHYRGGDDYGFTETLNPLHILDGVSWVQSLLRKPIYPNQTPENLAADVGEGHSDYQDFDLRVTESACDWIASRNDTPWAAFVSWLAPHFPLVAPAEFYDLYDPKTFESEAEGTPDHPIMAELRDYFSHDDHFTPETRGQARAGYYGLCSFVDAQVGKVLQALEASGQADNTLILFTSDHGEMLGEKGIWTKSTMYDSAAKIPLIMAGPNIAPGQWDHPVSLIDLAPTICTAMGVNADFTGTDLRAPDANRAVISEYHDGGCSVGMTMLRWDHWKLVHYAESNPPQLFNLDEDPEELTNLAPTHPSVLQDGMALLAGIFNPEKANAKAHADQARKVAALGGRDAILARGQFDFTPVG